MSEYNRAMKLPWSRRALTARQLAVLHAIARATETTGYPPTVRELASGTATSRAICNHVQALRMKGCLRAHTTKRARDMVLTERGRRLAGGATHRLDVGQRCQACGALHFCRRCVMCEGGEA